MSQWTRRDFLQSLFAGMSAIAVGSPEHLLYASTPERRRRHLINIQGFGAWDSAWHHSPMLQKRFGALLTQVSVATDQQGNHGVRNKQSKHHRFPFF